LDYKEREMGKEEEEDYQERRQRMKVTFSKGRKRICFFLLLLSLTAT